MHALLSSARLDLFGQGATIFNESHLMKKILLPLVFVATLLAAPVTQAAPVTFTAVLNGATEEPFNASPGIGFATLIYDIDLHTLSVSVSFSGLVSPTTVAHVHCCTAASSAGNAAVATQTPTFSGFPLGVTAGTYTNLFDMTLLSSYRAGFIASNGGTSASAEVALMGGMAAGKAYFNIHTVGSPGGEIRGFLVQATDPSVPEPGSLALLALGMVCVAFATQRKVKGKSYGQEGGDLAHRG